MPMAVAILRAGSNVVSRTLRRASDMPRPPAIAANTVTCNPEMLMRCVMPVRLNTRHWASGIARSSPIASATMTPAYGASGSAATMRSRTAVLARST